jgi:hypothetical protein
MWTFDSKTQVTYGMNLFLRYSNYLRRGNFFRSLLGILCPEIPSQITYYHDFLTNKMHFVLKTCPEVPTKTSCSNALVTG